MSRAIAPLHVPEQSWQIRCPSQDIVNFTWYSGSNRSPNTENFEVTVREGKTEQKFHIEKEKNLVHPCTVRLKNVCQAPKLLHVEIRDCHVDIKNINLQPTLKTCQSVSRGLDCEGKNIGNKVKSTEQSSNPFRILNVCSISPLIEPIPSSSPSKVPSSTKYRNINENKFNELLNTNMSSASTIQSGKCPFCFCFDEKQAGSLAILQQHFSTVHDSEPFSSNFDSSSKTKLTKDVEIPGSKMSSLCVECKKQF